jgi:hypothetical protein
MLGPKNSSRTVTPEVVTHRYDPARGMCLNICALTDFEASRVLDQSRQVSRPKLKPDYLARRRKTEEWLSKTAREALGRALERLPVYFFLGDFSYFADLSGPAALVVPLATLPADTTTFTLGDSMSVAEHPMGRVYKLEAIVEMFERGDRPRGFGLSDKLGFQTRFVEVQVWDSSSLPGHAV